MRIIITIFITLSILLPATAECSPKKSKAYNKYYKQLDNIKINKIKELHTYMRSVENIAKSINNDKDMKDFFIMKRHLYNQIKNTTPNDEQLKMQSYIRESIINLYLERYMVFYDLLFIDENGEIFYTNRRQSDFHKNIFKGSLAKTVLSKKLKENNGDLFVDYQNFEVSKEPSAFFIQPCIVKGKHIGWFVMQFAINKINEMFSVEQHLGNTGEVFIVNENRYMLTDSRFKVESSVLKTNLSKENISAKFKERSGHKIVTDYRGYKALTSFEVVSIMGSKWLIIAKIDENEILTNLYTRMSKKQKKDFIHQSLSNINYKYTKQYDLLKDIEVDMDEYKRTSNNKPLYTHGVSTCTTFIFSLKNKFAYMAHVSALDKIYGGNQTDLINRIMKQIDDFDAVRMEKNNIKVQIISPEIRYTTSVIDNLIEWGLLISQIQLTHNPKAKYANISHSQTSNTTLVNWNLQTLSTFEGQNIENVTNLAQEFKKISFFK